MISKCVFANAESSFAELDLTFLNNDIIIFDTVPSIFNKLLKSLSDAYFKNGFAQSFTTHPQGHYYFFYNNDILDNKQATSQIL